MQREEEGGERIEGWGEKEFELEHHSHPLGV